jgi:ATP-dependent DNA helicase
VPIGGSAKAGEARQTIAEMAAELLELEGEHIEVVQSTAAGKRGIISDAELDMLLDRRKEVFDGRRVGWKSGKAAKSGGVKASSSSSSPSRTPTASPRRSGGAGSGLFEVYQAPVDEGNDALAHMLGEEVAV